MLSAEQNELLTRVNPGTPMGELLRQYWIPALMSDELPEPNGPPVRIRLLCENLVAFRATSGKVGLIQSACAHRGADLFFGRNEGEGIRCIYHGWEYDLSGNVVDTPAELDENQTYKYKVKATAYPCAERGRLIWAYMGPRTTPPPLPDVEANMVPNVLRAQQIECNWIQVLENNMDTSHIGFLHFGSVDPEAGGPWIERRHGMKYLLRHKAPRFNVISTPSGAAYSAYRDAEEDTYYHRIMMFHLPFFTQTPAADIYKHCQYVATVPIDNEHTMQWSMNTDIDREERFENANKVLPNTSGYLGRFRPAVGLAHDMNIDRELQRSDQTWKGYSGIATISLQDRGIAESQGIIQDRTKEHLAGTDAMIIHFRKLLVDAANTVRDGGTPPAVDNPRAYRQRSGGIILPRDADVWEATRELREAFKD